MIYTTLDDFYLSPEQLADSPSRKDNVDAALEDQLRRYGCDIIGEAAVLLGLPQGVAATAQVLLQRFYCKRSLAEHDVKVAAMSSFWLAAKLEEVIEIDSPTKLKLRDVLMAFYRTIRRREGKVIDLLDPYSRRYDELKTAVVKHERHMLRAFGFIVHVEHPHRFVLTFGQLLGMSREPLQEAWNLANDSLRTTLCVRYKAEVIACGILFMAARRVKLPMPENPPWWSLFNVSKAQLYDVCDTLHTLYQQAKPQYLALARDLTSRGVDGRASPVAVASPEKKAGMTAAADSGGGKEVARGDERRQSSAEMIEHREAEGAQQASGAAETSNADPTVAAIAAAAATAAELAKQAQQPGHNKSRKDKSRSRDRSRDRKRESDRGHHRRRSRSRSRSRSRHHHRQRYNRDRSRSRSRDRRRR